MLGSAPGGHRSRSHARWTGTVCPAAHDERQRNQIGSANRFSGPRYVSGIRVTYLPFEARAMNYAVNAKTRLLHIHSNKHAYTGSPPIIIDSQSVRRSYTSFISEKCTEFEQNSIRNKILVLICRLKDDTRTSMRAVPQNASVVRTLFDLFIYTLAMKRFPSNQQISQP